MFFCTVSEIRKYIREKQAICVFSEPQFKPKIVEMLLESTSVKHGVLDPLGKSENLGVKGYIALLENLTNSLYQCLNDKHKNPLQSRG